MKTRTERTSKNTASTSGGRKESGTKRLPKSAARVNGAKSESSSSENSKVASSPSSIPSVGEIYASFPPEKVTGKRGDIVTSLLGEDVGPDRSDWARVDAMTEEEIERNAANDPDNPIITDFSKAVIVQRPKKESIHLRVDADVLDWFRSNGAGYLTYMNSVLRVWYELKSKQAAVSPPGSNKQREGSVR